MGNKIISRKIIVSTQKKLAFRWGYLKELRSKSKIIQGKNYSNADYIYIVDLHISFFVSLIHWSFEIVVDLSHFTDEESEA
jgi:hypothetical protein